jgi:transposase
MPPGAKGRRYPDELRERAVRMVFDHQHEYPSQWKAVESVAEKLDVHRETLRVWVRKAEVEHGQRAGMTSTERERLKELEHEVKELRRANEILKAAAGFFARELDPRPPKP